LDPYKQRAAVALCLGFAAGVSTQPVRAQAALPAPVAASLAAAGIAANGVAAFVQEVGSASPLLAFNTAQPMNPASTMKLLTTYAALELLGPSFTWKTEAYASGAMSGDVLEGDLVLRGTGDPKLTVENFWLLLRGLRARGLREIRGDLVLDRGYFESFEEDAASFDNEPLRSYNVSPDALLLNFKTVRFTFSPDLERRRVQVVAEPRPAQLELAQSVRLSEGPCGDWRTRIKAEFRSSEGGARASFSGTYPASCGEQTWNVALLPHGTYVYGVFRQLWGEMGGVLRGGFREGNPRPGSALLFSLDSPSLAEVVRDINKFSNNVMARQLFLTLSGEILRLPASAERSSAVIQSWLKQKSLEFPELVIENGAGLSRRERISAGHLGALLLLAWKSPVMPEFIASMPLVAYDGTMRRRMNFDPIAGQAHIKTGSLSDARAAAGYVLDRNGRRFAVVFIINHANAAAGEVAQDVLLRWIYEGAAS
jgi:D-alanyl-D-alanine carboxypeptidase/D-alanyl-D-alanine-endopeptidase (penicillin-binding protein 4)